MIIVEWACSEWLQTLNISMVVIVLLLWKDPLKVTQKGMDVQQLQLQGIVEKIQVQLPLILFSCWQYSSIMFFLTFDRYEVFF